MGPVHLIDTPRRTTLAAHSAALRSKLKDWEKSFAASHAGQKPGKDDIKACLVIAKTYKEYNSVRDVLAGSLSMDSFDKAVCQSPMARKRVKSSHGAEGQSSDRELRREAMHACTPRKAKSPPYQRMSAPHPNLLDPYDPPTSISPRPYQVTAIGPTPQRDGKALGLFDLLPSSANSSHATPSTRKRKNNTMGDWVPGAIGLDTERTVVQTPSRKRLNTQESSGDILDHLASTTPRSHQRHSRTPASEGKKFMLSHFFATPSTMRFTDMTEDQYESRTAQVMVQGAGAAQTPLRTQVLGDQANATVETWQLVDATPVYLKRSYSFKDRLLSVSSCVTGTADAQRADSSTSSILAGPPTLRRFKSGPKPLSQIMQGLRQMEDERFDDDLDALRESEGGRLNVCVEDSQINGTGAGAKQGSEDLETELREEYKAPTRVWRKKGQKRTTRRANMKPVRMKPGKENQWVVESSGSEDGDVDETEAVEETQLAIQQTAAAAEDGEYDSLGLDLPTPKASEGGSDAGLDNGSEADDLDDYKEQIEGKADRKRVRKVGLEADATKSARNREKIKDTVATDRSRRKKGPTINPNAVSHQNFRTLKIRNKNSKAKGKRFGRRG